MDYELRIKKAILEVKQGTSIRLAAEQHSLCQTTLLRRTKKPNRSQMGRPCSLTTYQLDTFSMLLTSKTFQPIHAKPPKYMLILKLRKYVVYMQNYACGPFIL